MQKPSNLREALWPILIVKAIFGCIIINDLSTKCLLMFNVIYMIVLWIGYFVAFFKVIDIFYRAPWYTYEEEIFLIVLYAQNCVVVVNLVAELYYQKRRLEATSRWSHVDQTLQQLGVHINYYVYFVDQIIVIFLWFFLNAILIFFDMLWLKDKVTPLENFAMILVIQHSLHANSFLESCFIVPIKHLGMRYRLINRLLDALIARNCKDNFFQQHKTRYSDKVFQIKIQMDSATVRSSKTILQILKQVHLELTNVTKEMTDISGIKMTMAIAGTFVLLTGMLYLIYLHLVIHRGVSFDDRRLIILVIWVVQNAVKFYAMNAVCSFTAAEFNKARVIIHNLKIVTKDEELQHEIKQFSLQIMQSDLNFEPCGLFEMGYNAISTVASSVTTLLVILMQISVMKPQST